MLQALTHQSAYPLASSNHTQSNLLIAQPTDNVVKTPPLIAKQRSGNRLTSRLISFIEKQFPGLKPTVLTPLKYRFFHPGFSPTSIEPLLRTLHQEELQGFYEASAFSRRSDRTPKHSINHPLIEDPALKLLMKYFQPTAKKLFEEASDFFVGKEVVDGLFIKKMQFKLTKNPLELRGITTKALLQALLQGHKIESPQLELLIQTLSQSSEEGYQKRYISLEKDVIVLAMKHWRAFERQYNDHVHPSNYQLIDLSIAAELPFKTNYLLEEYGQLKEEHTIISRTLKRATQQLVNKYTPTS